MYTKYIILEIGYLDFVVVSVFDATLMHPDLLTSLGAH